LTRCVERKRREKKEKKDNHCPATVKGVELHTAGIRGPRCRAEEKGRERGGGDGYDWASLERGGGGRRNGHGAGRGRQRLLGGKPVLPFPGKKGKKRKKIFPFPAKEENLAANAFRGKGGKERGGFQPHNTKKEGKRVRSRYSTC